MLSGTLELQRQTCGMIKVLNQMWTQYCEAKGLLHSRVVQPKYMQQARSGIQWKLSVSRIWLP
jgi:hypothetical protein